MFNTLKRLSFVSAVVVLVVSLVSSAQASEECAPKISIQPAQVVFLKNVKISHLMSSTFFSSDEGSSFVMNDLFKAELPLVRSSGSECFYRKHPLAVSVTSRAYSDLVEIKYAVSRYSFATEEEVAHLGAKARGIIASGGYVYSDIRMTKKGRPRIACYPGDECEKDWNNITNEKVGRIAIKIEKL